MITVDFSPLEEAQIAALAQQAGLASAEYATALVWEHLQKLAQDENEAEPSETSK